MDWRAFLSTLGLLPVVELGGKTQLAVIAQSCKYGRPWTIFPGATLALGAVTALSVLGGRSLTRESLRRPCAKSQRWRSLRWGC